MHATFFVHKRTLLYVLEGKKKYENEFLLRKEKMRGKFKKEN